MPGHIGIVALSPEGSSFCYRTIGRRAAEVDDPSQRPMITLHNQPFSTYMEALERGDWGEVARLLEESARVLRDAGAEFCVLPDNVAHHALPMVEQSSVLPWLNMIEIVADAIAGAGCSSVGLIGTKHVTSGGTYQTLLGLKGIHLLVPDEEEALAVDRVILSEAIFGSVRPESRALVQRAINNLGAKGCEAVILGCSEASLLTAVGENAMALFDPVELLAEAAIERSLSLV